MPLTLTHDSAGWWIHGVDTYEVDGEPFDSCGPYATKADAADDLRGIKRFLERVEIEK